MPQPLARLTDPQQLDAATGPRAELRVLVQRDLLQAGCRLELAVPEKLRCARCGGGGCDGCERSGALRAPEPAHRRVIALTVPPGVGGASVRLRLPTPFEGCAIEQLLIELQPAESSSAGVQLLPPARLAGGAVRTGQPTRLGLLLTVALALVLAAMLLTLARRCRAVTTDAHSQDPKQLAPEAGQERYN